MRVATRGLVRVSRHSNSHSHSIIPTPPLLTPPAVEVRRESQWGRVGAKFAQGCVWAGLQVACKVAYRTLPPTWAWLSFNPHLVLTERFAEWSFWQRQLYMAGVREEGLLCMWEIGVGWGLSSHGGRVWASCNRAVVFSILS